MFKVAMTNGGWVTFECNHQKKPEQNVCDDCAEFVLGIHMEPIIGRSIAQRISQLIVRYTKKYRTRPDKIVMNSYDWARFIKYYSPALASDVSIIQEDIEQNHAIASKSGKNKMYWKLGITED